MNAKQNMVMATEIQNLQRVKFFFDELQRVKLVLGLGGWSVYFPTLIFFEFQ